MLLGHRQLRPAVLLLPDHVRSGQHDRGDDAARRPPGAQRPARARRPAASPTIDARRPARPAASPRSRPRRRRRPPARDGPLPRTTARTTSQPSAVVLSRSKVVVVTKWPTASAKPDDAVHAAAITWARRAAADLARDQRRQHRRRRRRERRRQPQHQQRPRRERVHRPGQQRHERRLVGIAERRMRPGDDEVQLVAVVAVPRARRDQHRNRTAAIAHTHPESPDPRPVTSSNAAVRLRRPAGGPRARLCASRASHSATEGAAPSWGEHRACPGDGFAGLAGLAERNQAPAPADQAAGLLPDDGQRGEGRARPIEQRQRGGRIAGGLDAERRGQIDGGGLPQAMRLRPRHQCARKRRVTGGERRVPRAGACQQANIPAA